MELPSTELGRTTATLLFPEKVRSGSTSHSVTSHSRDNKASFYSSDDIKISLMKYLGRAGFVVCFGLVFLREKC